MLQVVQRSWAAALGALLISAAPVLAAPALAAPPLDAPSGETYVRVVDVGNGLCVVVRTPDHHTLLYDAGAPGSFCRKALLELAPEKTIDLVVISHSDSDHIAELPAILKDWKVGEIIYTGDAHRPVTTNAAEIKAINAANIPVKWNLKQTPLTDDDPGHARVIPVGAGSVTVIAGWGNANDTRIPGDKALPDAEYNNVVSVVVRFDYGGHSILLSGDTIGRYGDDPPATCILAERFMVQHAAAWPVRADVLIGQHHGGDNSTSNCFITAVQPDYVVFSAGHKGFQHPRASTVTRLLKAGVAPDHILRTDIGDSEGPKEWIYGSYAGCKDKAGDDDVEIFMPPAGAGDLRIGYRTPKTSC